MDGEQNANWEASSKCGQKLRGVHIAEISNTFTSLKLMPFRAY